MKIVVLNTYQKRGGAALACWNMFQALKKANYDVKHLTLFGLEKSDDYAYFYKEKGIVYWLNFIRRSIYEVFLRFRFPKRTPIKFSPDTSILRKIKHTWISDADIVFVNWIHDGFLNSTQIRQFAKEKKVIWFMHDMWPLTGGCHYSFQCNGFMHSCGNCLVLNKKTALAKMILTRKKKFNNVIFTGSSDWILNKQTLAAVASEAPSAFLPLFNGDIGFKPETHQKTDNIVVKLIFGAAGGHTNWVKGFDLLLKALYIVLKHTNRKIRLQMFGSETAAQLPFSNVESENLGYISDKKELMNAFGNADIYINPSRAETFGQTTLESLISGTPVVAFENTGTSSLIEHKKNGYHAKYENPDSLAEGILYLIEHPIRVIEPPKGYSESDFIAAFKRLVQNFKHLSLVD